MNLNEIEMKEQVEHIEYARFFALWKIKRLECPNCQGRDLSPPNQYCTKRYVCKSCNLEFDPLRPLSNWQLFKWNLREFARRHRSRNLKRSENAI